MNTPTQTPASPLSEERVREIQYDLATIVGPTGWRWSQCYEITNEIGVTEKHWALTSDESDARGIVVSGWLVLAATEPRGYDGRPLDENRHLRFIENAPTYLAELLADRTALTARLEAVERERDAEREKAAKVCESRAESLPPIEANEARKCARAIRAKGFASPFRPARVAERAEPAKPRMFPIMHGPEIPWSAIAPFEDQAKRNHCGQTLNELAARGGLSPREALCVMHRVRWDSSEESNRIAALSHADACRELQQLAAAMTASRS